MYDFRWIEWNIGHIAEHGISPEDAEYVVNHAKPPFPRRTDAEQFLVWGQVPDGSYLQVVFILDDDGTAFVIHAMPMTENQKRQLRRKRR
jgi:hypothetical protein